MNALDAKRIGRFTNVKHLTWCALAFLIGSSISLQAEPPRRSILSKSHQYTISSTLVQPLPVPSTQAQPIPDRVHLSPYKLAYFTEAVKDRVLLLLKLPPRGQWIGRIHLNIVPGKLGDPVIFKRKRFIDRWDYRLDFPEVMNGRELARLIVAVQLEEYAARNSANAPPMPAWLTEGLAETILHSSGPLLYVPFQNAGGGALNFRFPNFPLEASRKIIQASKPVSFLDLSLPPAAVQTDNGRLILRAHSHLLAVKLLAKPDGAKRMKYFLRELPKHKNNQHAFLTAFNLQSMLKAEQWWMLTQTQFRSRDAFNRWIPGIALTHLADALQVSVLRPPESGTTPQRDLISIQKFLKTGSREEHQKKLEPLMQRLLVIQLNGPPKTARLVRDYRATLELYLGRKTKLNLRAKPSARKALLELTVQLLNELDIILADLQVVQKTDEARGKQTAAPERDVD